MIHTYQLIETDTNDDQTPWKVSRLLGELNAAKSWLAQCRATADFVGDLDYRTANEGDDPIDTYSDNALIDIRRNASVEALLRAEGILACAQRRYDRWDAKNKQEESEREAVRQKALKSETDDERIERERLEAQLDRDVEPEYGPAERSVWDATP